MQLGSNWGIFAPDNPDKSLNGLIPRYHTNPATVADQFTQAKANGQTWVSLPIWFYDGAKDGFAVDCTGGNPDVQSKANLQAIARLIHSVGFAGVLLRFAPEGGNNAASWTEWREGVYQTDWNFLINCVLAVEQAAPGLSLMLDLHIEGIPRQGTAPQQEAYLKRLWGDINVPSFWNKMPKTVSFIPEPGIVQQIPKLFTPPLDFIAPDLYAGSAAYPTVYDGFVMVHDNLRGSNHAGKPTCVTETDMNDPDNAVEFKLAARDTGATLLGVYQWPVTRTSHTGTDFDGQPLDASAYRLLEQHP